MPSKVALGDVFLIPVDSRSFAIGQVAGIWNDELYIAVFPTRVQEEPHDLVEVTGQAPALLALTFDSKLRNGDWKPLGKRQNNVALLPQAAYKVGRGGMIFIESRDRKTMRPATGAEVADLQFRVISSPAVVEDAVRAMFGLGEWTPHYDQFLAEYAEKSSRLIDRLQSDKTH